MRGKAKTGGETHRTHERGGESGAGASPSSDKEAAGAGTAPAGPEAPAPAPEAATAQSPEAVRELPPAALDEELKEMTAERDALQERLLRLQADFDNFRKRTARERNDMYLRANEDLVRELLPVLDHLDLALAADETGGESAFVKGVQLVADQFLAVLAKFGVRPFNAEGEPFDPQKHEAVSEEPSATISANVVISQISRGFMLGERLLRAPRVIVSSGPETRQEPAG